MKGSAASDVTVDSKVNHKMNTKVGPKVKTRESSRSTKGVAGGRERRSCRPLLVPPPPPTKEALSAAVLSAASTPEDSCKRVPYALAAAKAVKNGSGTGVRGVGLAAEAEVCEEVASAGSRYVGVSGARFAEPVLNAERGTGVEEETEEDEISRTITEDWERLKKAELTALYHIVKLQGVSVVTVGFGLIDVVGRGCGSSIIVIALRQKKWFVHHTIFHGKACKVRGVMLLGGSV